jgi:hypothetical protein
VYAPDEIPGADIEWTVRGDTTFVLDDDIREAPQTKSDATEPSRDLDYDKWADARRQEFKDWRKQVHSPSPSAKQFSRYRTIERGMDIDDDDFSWGLSTKDSPMLSGLLSGLLQCC